MLLATCDSSPLAVGPATFELVPALVWRLGGVDRASAVCVGRASASLPYQPCRCARQAQLYQGVDEYPAFLCSPVCVCEAAECASARGGNTGMAGVGVQSSCRSMPGGWRAVLPAPVAAVVAVFHVNPAVVVQRVRYVECCQHCTHSWDAWPYGVCTRGI